MHRLILLSLIFQLLSCSEKTDFVRDQKRNDTHSVNQVLLIVDYVHLLDDVGNYLDYDEDVNLQQNDQYLLSLKSILESKAYSISPQVMQSSALYVREGWFVEHYKSGQLQNGLINPPYFIKSNDLDDNFMLQARNLLIDLMRRLDPYIVDRGVESQNYLHSMNFSQFTENMDVPDDTGILILQVNKMRMSAVKKLGLVLATAAASQNSRVQVGFYGNYSPGMSNAYFIHKGSGQLLWSNYKFSAMPPKQLEKFFLSFPKLENSSR